MINFVIVTSRKIKDCIDLIYNVKFKISHMKGFSLVMIERIKLCISYKYIFAVKSTSNSYEDLTNNLKLT